MLPSREPSVPPQAKPKHTPKRPQTDQQSREPSKQPKANVITKNLLTFIPKADDISLSLITVNNNLPILVSLIVK